MAVDLIAACGRRNVLLHLHDEISLEPVIAAVEPAVTLYRGSSEWCLQELGE
jgi:hypothetical protein